MIGRGMQHVPAIDAVGTTPLGKTLLALNDTHERSIGAPARLRAQAL
jgi:hypothetical protein